MLLESILLQHLSKIRAIVPCPLSILVWTSSATACLQHDYNKLGMYKRTTNLPEAIEQDKDRP